MSLLLRSLRGKQLLHNITTRCAGPTTQSRVSSTTNPNKPEKDKEPKFTVEFKKPTDVKKVFKEFYSLYGPMFIGCHIGVSLISLGFFSSLVWLSIDPTKIIPDVVMMRMGETMTSITGEGGKFVVAYALHKAILPIRLGCAIFLTKILSQKVKRFRK